MIESFLSLTELLADGTEQVSLVAFTVEVADIAAPTELADYEAKDGALLVAVESAAASEFHLQTVYAGRVTAASSFASPQVMAGANGSAWEAVGGYGFLNPSDTSTTKVLTKNGGGSQPWVWAEPVFAGTGNARFILQPLTQAELDLLSFVVQGPNASITLTSLTPIAGSDTSCEAVDITVRFGFGADDYLDVYLPLKINESDRYGIAHKLQAWSTKVSKEVDATTVWSLAELSFAERTTSSDTTRAASTADVTNAVQTTGWLAGAAASDTYVRVQDTAIDTALSDGVYYQRIRIASSGAGGAEVGTFRVALGDSRCYIDMSATP